MSYALFAALVATGVLIGRIIDAAIGRLYDPSLKRWLQDSSLGFNEVKYWDIVSTSPERAMQVHRWIAGRRFLSWQALVAALLMSVSSFLFFLALNGDMIANMYMQGQTQQQVWSDIFKNFGFVLLGLMIAFFLFLKLAWQLHLYSRAGKPWPRFLRHFRPLRPFTWEC